MKKETIIFCDGASKGNPGPGGWGAIVHLPSGEVLELGGHEKNTTNNKMELTAAINALESLTDNRHEIILNTDSSYLVNGITKWVKVWQRNNWITSTKEPVLNSHLWKRLIETVSDKKIKWNYVGGHIGIEGNERADLIASSYAAGLKHKLFKGKISDYEVDLDNIIGSQKKKEKKSKNSAKAYSYLSLVNGVLKVDKTWEECEKRVKGVKNAKYKKAESPEDEERIIKEWLQSK